MLNQDDYETLLIDKRPNGVAIVTLNRPEKLNAVDAAMHYELSRIFLDAEADTEVRVVLLTGAGRAFCAGGDFGSGSAPGDAGGGGNMMREARQIVDNLLDCSKPVISAVNGYAMGLGATVALLADIVVASDKAIFADTHVNMGIGAGDGGAVIWPLLMGVNRAKYYLMTGERLAAAEAERLGLVNFVVEHDALLERATGIATRLAEGPAKAISASKVPINKFIKMVSNLVLPISLSLEEATMASTDAKEAAKAFVEKRKPRFSGH
jgi:enoyl-CoA hydratase